MKPIVTNSIVHVDPANNPDGMCWTVVERYGDKTVARHRFATKSDAECYARSIRPVRGLLVHIEGPKQENGNVDA